MIYTNKSSHIRKKNFFEGWYFKQQSNDLIIVFIPGISIDKKGNKKVFIQVIKDNLSDWQYYEDYYADKKKLYLKIGNNIFSDKGLEIDFKGQKIQVKGKLNFSKFHSLKKTLYSPSIMGPFSYLSFMECYHGIESLHHLINGSLLCNGEHVIFNNNIGYIEKDYGHSFPSAYLWLQCNDFGDKIESFFLSIAEIPILKMTFKGVISVLLFDDKEYRFATYNMTKLIKLSKNNNTLEIRLKKNKFMVIINAVIDNSTDLLAPKNGDMSFLIKEFISGTINIKLYRENQLVFERNGKNAGIEFHNLSQLIKPAKK